MLNHFPRLITGLAMLLLCFEQLIFYVQKNPVGTLDILFSKMIQRHASPLLDRVNYSVSCFEKWPYALGLTLLMTLVAYRHGGKRMAKYVLGSYIVGLVGNFAAKLIIYRPRPSSKLVRVLVESHTSSFPSGTVIIYVLFFGFLMVIGLQRKGLPGLVRNVISVISMTMISFIGLARVYLGAHWISDVLGGYIIGMILLIPYTLYYLRKTDTDHETHGPQV